MKNIVWRKKNVFPNFSMTPSVDSGMFSQVETTIVQQTGMMSIFYKILIGASLLFAFVLIAMLNSKKMSHEAKRNGLLLEIIGNVSNGLEKLDSGLETIMAETKLAKGRLQQLVALQRENLVACATRLRDKRAEILANPTRIDFKINEKNHENEKRT